MTVQTLRYLTQANATVLQQIAQMVEHGTLVLPADSAEVAEEAAAACHHLGEADLLQGLDREGECLHSMSLPELTHLSKPLTFDSPPPRTFTMTSMTVSCIPSALIRFGCW